MFEYARIKLTVSYIVIIMLVSFAFSLAIYRGVTTEFKRGYGRIERSLNKDNLPGNLLEQRRRFILEDTRVLERAVIVQLMYANGIIFVLSALTSYYMAGKSLRPIRLAMDEQRRFIADASHELRTPITALKTSLQVGMRDKGINKRSKQVLDSGLEDVNRLQALSDDLLTLSKYHEGILGKQTKFDTSKVIKGVIRKMKPLINEKELTINLSLDKQAMFTDRDSIEQLITILLDNAIKYSKKNGEINIQTNETKNGHVVRIQDNGIGISKKDLPHIFDRFYQASNSRTKSGKNGHGLGLSLAKKIVELHSGTISVKSKINKGSTFTVKLPR